MDSCDEDGWEKTEMRKMKKTQKRMMTDDDDEGNDGVTDDLLALYQVRLAPVSRQQSSVKICFVP